MGGGEVNKAGGVGGMSFEAALLRLEEIVGQLESGEVELERAVKLYEEGSRLRVFCEARLKEAQFRIDRITKGEDGKLGLKRADDI